jgi:glycosyltransferase involved in cell wall biosynthesis
VSLASKGIRLRHHASPQCSPTHRIWNKLSRSRTRSEERLKRFRPDLVVISQGGHSGGFNWARACRQAGIPYVMLAHCNYEGWSFRQQLNDAVESYKHARKVFYVSHGNFELLQLQLGEYLANAELVRNPYNVSPEISIPWPQEEGRWRLAGVARIEVAAKGQDLLLRTFARPEWRSRPIELNLYGTGPDEAMLRRMQEFLQLKNVHLRGHVSDVQTIWGQNHLLVLPSRFEGLPLALTEAMWCGRPAVVTDVGGNAELCIDGKTGFVAPSATVSAFSATLERAWERRGEWRQLGDAARSYVDKQIPRDPTRLFANELKSLASQTCSAARVLAGR